MQIKIVKGSILILTLGSFLLFWLYDGSQYLTLEYVKSVQGQIGESYSQNKWPIIFLFGLSYTIATALSFPGAGVMTVAAGAFFDLFHGTLIVSISSTLGASLAFLLTRTFFRDYVQQKFADKLVAFNEGIEREGGFYLFTMRLIPVFPFFIINSVMALTKMRLKTFFFVSMLGMLPGTIAFVNAGRELAKIDSLSGILSPSLLLSLVLIGILPLFAKKTIAILRRKKIVKMEK
ncbi:MAG: TVP38/TMEM64 family protein [Desulfotalea sp.]